MDTRKNRATPPRRGRALGSAAIAAALAFALLAACSKTTEVTPAAPSSARPGPSPIPASPAAASAPSTGTSGADTYDVAKMDFKPGPAIISSERHTGAFAAGDALSIDATVKPITPAPVKEVRLDTTHKIIEIAPGVKFSAWTFGDQVPGLVVRVRVGDRVKFSMTNRSDEPAPGLKVTAAPMMRSMDFHSAMVSPQNKYRSVAPGQTINFEFTANYPGVYMYHCGTPMALEHIASGMYGMMIVEPKGGYPTKVDHEYAIVQSEFYTKLDPEKRKVDARGVSERVRATAPKIRGVRPGTVHASVAPAAFSFAIDHRTQTPEAAVAELERCLAVPGLHLSVIRVQ